MKNYFLFLILISGTLTSAKSNAQSPGTCPELTPVSGNMQGQVVQTSKGCAVMLSPNVPPGTALRRYSFSQRGVIQIFNQYADNSNGSRSFFVFPRRQIPILRAINNEEMDVVTSAGDLIKFDTSANPPHIVYDNNASFRMTEDPDVSKLNDGGVEIVRTKTSQTLLLDSGFMLGGTTFTQANRPSTFYDSVGNDCTLINSELFTFSNYDADLKFHDDAELFSYLKTACPTLVLPQL